MDDEGIRAPEYKTGSLFSFPMQPLLTSRYFKSNSNVRAIEDFLFPKNLENKYLMPYLNKTSKMNIHKNATGAEFQSHFDDFEEETEELSLDEKIKLFSAARKNLFSTISTQSKKVQRIIINPDIISLAKDPTYHENVDSYSKLGGKQTVKDDRSKKRDSTNVNSTNSESSTVATESVIVTTDDKSFGSAPQSDFSLSDFATGDSLTFNPAKIRKSRNFEDKDLEIQLGSSMIDQMSLDANEFIPHWLNTLPNSSPSTNHAVNHNFNTDDSSLTQINILDEAFRSALASHQILEASFIEEETYYTQERDTKKPMTAEELTEDWGFKDQSIAKIIQKFIKTQNAESKSKKK